MIWILAGGVAIAAFLVIAFVLKAPRSGYEAVAAALALGIAGYAMQASPNIPAAPKPATQKIAGNAAALVEARKSLEGEPGPAGDNFLIIGDALARNGRFADAAGVMLGAVRKNPNDGDAWLGIANSLVAHADEQLTPASRYAFRRAAEADAESPGPPFFLGMALAQSGRLAEARAIWAELLERSPADAPWREDLQQRLQQLDAFVAQQQAVGNAP